jgi:cytochrome c-type biogenesis protein CcmE
MKARQKRLVLVALGIVGVGIAAFLVNKSLQGNLNYYFSPTKVMAGEAPRDQVIRVGGLVEKGTLKRQEDGLTVQFVVTDNAEQVTISYTGILPDLFNEGQGVVTKGKLGEDGVFYAEEVLAKHDESYMAPEVADSLQTAHNEGVAKMAEGSAKGTAQ